MRSKSSLNQVSSNTNLIGGLLAEGLEEHFVIPD